MIHDVQVEVTCDRAGCTTNIYVPLDYHPGHGYDHEIETRICLVMGG